jgi:hypothetical protein
MDWDLGAEVHDAAKMVYLITFARLLPGTAPAAGLQDIQDLTRASIMDAVRDAWAAELPVGPQGGRARSRDDSRLAKAVVFQEFHGDGAQSYVTIRTQRIMTRGSLCAGAWGCVSLHGVTRFVFTPREAPSTSTWRFA